MRYALKIFYFADSRYEGFQRQTEKITIEGQLIQAFLDSGLIEDIDSAGYEAAGRTDRGVHALGQVVALTTFNKLIIPAINSFLPEDIIIWSMAQVKDQFTPRYEALSRYYRYYTFYSGEDLELMRTGAKMLEGIHDFKLFAKIKSQKSSIREIHQIIIEKKEPFLIFHVIANSFLWHMARRIVDCLLKIGQLQWQLEDVQNLLNLTPKPNVQTRSRSTAGPGALILWDVEYPFQFQIDIKSLEKVKKAVQNYMAEFSLKNYYVQQFYDFFDSIKEK